MIQPATEAAKYYLKQQGLSATAKQIEKLEKQFPATTIIMMAKQRGFTMLINNEGQYAIVSPDCYNGLQAAFNEGCCACLVNDTNGCTHMVILEDNFKYSA